MTLTNSGWWSILVLEMKKHLFQMAVAARYATEIWSSSNVCRCSICDALKGRVQMLKLHSKEWSFFVEENVYGEWTFLLYRRPILRRFPDRYLMRNNETVNGQAHDRPCFYAFLDNKTGLFWMIPFSSQVDKYRVYYDKKLRKFGRCDTIAFGEVLGHEKAFLIQNMCPITSKYIKNEYIDRVANIPVRVDLTLEKELIE